MTSPEENKAVVRRFFAEIDAGNVAAMDELVAVDYVDHRVAPFPGLPAGLAGLKRAFEIFLSSGPAWHEIISQVAEGDLVITRIRVRGCFPKIDTDVTATAVHRIRDGKLVEHFGELEPDRLAQEFGIQTAG